MLYLTLSARRGALVIAYPLQKIPGKANGATLTTPFPLIFRLELKRCPGMPFAPIGLAMTALRPLRALLFLTLGLAAFAASAAANPLFPPGSRIGLEPPGDVTLSKKFSGFEDARHGVIITVLDLPAQAYLAFEKTAFLTGAKDLTIEKRELFAFDSGVGFLITGHEDVKDNKFRSWFLLINTLNSVAGHIAALIAVRVPQAASAAYPDNMIRTALATVSFRRPDVQELLGLLPFKINELAGFRTTKVAPQGAVILIDGASEDLAKHAYMVISIGRGAPNEPDARPTFARDLLMRAPLPGLAITVAEAMRINGKQGYEIRANANGAAGEPLALVQWVRFGGGGNFLRVLGVVARDRWDELFPRFRTVRDSIEARR
jgi:hypothetical protein